MRTSVCKIFTFHAAHHLPHHEGICKEVHGHTYKLEVEVSLDNLIEEGSSEGMVVDFGNLKVLVTNRVLSILDHSDLNEIVETTSFGCGVICSGNPTVENLTYWIWSALDVPLVNLDLRLDRVRLWETDTCYAEIRRE